LIAGSGRFREVKGKKILRKRRPQLREKKKKTQRRDEKGGRSPFISLGRVKGFNACPS